MRFRFDERRGGESYRPTGRSGRSSSRGYLRHTRSPPRNRSPRLVADTWVPSSSRVYDRRRSRSPSFRRRSRSPLPNRDFGSGSYGRTRSPRRFSPRRDGRPRSPRQDSWRLRSPYTDNRSRDASWGRTTPKRPRELSPPNQDYRFPKRENPNPSASDRFGKLPSPSRRNSHRESVPRLPVSRSRSPFHPGRRERYPDTLTRRSPSPRRGVSSVHTSAQGSVTNSRRSSPLNHIDRVDMTPNDSRGRSPANPPIPHRPLSKPVDSSPSYQERVTLAKHKPHPQDEMNHRSPVEGRLSIPGPRRDSDNHGMARSAQDQQAADLSPSNAINTSVNVPSQPKAHGLLSGQLPPSGPSHASRSFPSHGRGPNVSLLSAPTRPRWSSGFRDNSWSGASARRGPIHNAPHGPVGPRGSYSSTGPGGEFHRHSVHRQNSVTSNAYSRPQRLTNHLAGLYSIIPGGKLLPSVLDPTMEKRLLQLEADQERLFEQIADRQKSKRQCIRDWDKLDRESTISALKSELAEGHLQCITDGESVSVGTIF